MSLSEDMQAKKPGEWTSDDISALQRKYRRTHFDHFSGVQLIDGQEWHIWSDGTRHRFKEVRQKEQE